MTETERRWPDSNSIARKLRDHIRLNSGFTLSQQQLDALEDVISAFWEAGGMTVERKISRLTEKLKDAIEQGVFGNLFEDDEGNPVSKTEFDPTNPNHRRTQAGEIFKAFQDIYKQSTLDSVDEEGELIE